jgi:hypothetical protein
MKKSYINEFAHQNALMYARFSVYLFVVAMFLRKRSMVMPHDGVPELAS